MSSEEKDMDLPVAVRCMREQNGYPDLESTAIGISILKPGDGLVEKSDAEEAIKEARKAERQKILKTLRMLQENFQHRVDVALEEKEDAKEDSWVKKRSVVRINCYDLAQRKIQKLCEELESDGLVEEVE